MGKARNGQNYSLPRYFPLSLLFPIQNCSYCMTLCPSHPQCSISSEGTVTTCEPSLTNQKFLCAFGLHLALPNVFQIPLFKKSWVSGLKIALSRLPVIGHIPPVMALLTHCCHPISSSITPLVHVLDSVCAGPRNDHPSAHCNLAGRKMTA